MTPCARCGTPRCDVCERAICSCWTRADAFCDDACACPPPDMLGPDAAPVTAQCPICHDPLRVYVIPKGRLATFDTRDESHRCIEQWDREQHITFQNDCADAFDLLQHWYRPGDPAQTTACGADQRGVYCHRNIHEPATCTLCEAERRRDLLALNLQG